MPMYDYHCSACKREFEAMNPISARKHSTCNGCGAIADKIEINPPRIDPHMDTPGARMKERKGMERRGRGADMTQANRTITDLDTDRNAHSVRQALGENPIITH